jgi:DAK2 domain fusion protein YloV
MPGPAPTPADPLGVLDVGAVRRWAVLVRAVFAAHREQLDALNVFPVPDGDTGTNLFLTVDGAVDRSLTETADAGAGELLVLFAKNLLWSARGNSGVILSQLARGLAEVCQGADVIDARTLAEGLVAGDRRAWQAVTDPKEGTILSVSRAAARAGSGQTTDRGLHTVAGAALEAARVALAHTPQQLEVLAKAGVVDAGGAGLVLLLECLERICAGDDGRALLSMEAVPADGPARPVQVTGPVSGAAPAYEVMDLLDEADESAADTLRERLVGLGDSVLVVGDGKRWTVHAHVDDAGAAIEAGMAAGRPHQIRVERLVAEQAADTATSRRDRGAESAREASGVVACVAGAGLGRVFAEGGAVVVLSRPALRASTGELIVAVRQCTEAGANEVIVLPNDPDTELAAAAAARVVADEGITVHVVSTRSVVQGIAALAVFEPGRSPGENVRAMQAAAVATRHGAVTIATREAVTGGGPCRAGDVLGLVGGDIAIVGTDVRDVGAEVARRLLTDGGELLTIIVGDGVAPELGDEVAAAVGRERAELETTVLTGGQPVHPLLLGVE